MILCFGQLYVSHNGWNKFTFVFNSQCNGRHTGNGCAHISSGNQRKQWANAINISFILTHFNKHSKLTATSNGWHDQIEKQHLATVTQTHRLLITLWVNHIGSTAYHSFFFFFFFFFLEIISANVHRKEEEKKGRRTFMAVKWNFEVGEM